jgi:hypothetical protein
MSWRRVSHLPREEAHEQADHGTSRRTRPPHQ